MRISDWSSDVCSSDLSACYRSPQPALEQRAEFRLRFVDAGETQAMPGHRQVARGERLAGGVLDLAGDRRDLQAGARTEHPVDVGPPPRGDGGGPGRFRRVPRRLDAGDAPEGAHWPDQPPLRPQNE